MRPRRRARQLRPNSANGGRKRRNGQAARQHGRKLVVRTEDEKKKKADVLLRLRGVCKVRYISSHSSVSQCCHSHEFGNTASFGTGACCKVDLWPYSKFPVLLPTYRAVVGFGLYLRPSMTLFLLLWPNSLGAPWLSPRHLNLERGFSSPSISIR
jgi:hypothetical protein